MLLTQCQAQEVIDQTQEVLMEVTTMLEFTAKVRDKRAAQL